MKRAEEWIDPRLIAFDPHNTNRMTKKQYQALVANVRETGGLTENVVVVDMRGDPAWDQPDTPYRCVSGEHRTRAAIDAGFTEIPVRVFTAEEWDQDKREIQGIRHNWINGEQDPHKFAALAKRLGEKYGEENVRDLLKITDKAKFDKLIKEATKNLPKDVADEVKRAAKEGRIETIDELSRLVNDMIGAYGDTLPHGFMILDYGGKQHVWVRLTDESRKALRDVRGELVKQRKSLDDLFGRLLTHPVTQELIEELPTVAKPDHGEIFKP